MSFFVKIQKSMRMTQSDWKTYVIILGQFYMITLKMQLKRKDYKKG